MKTSRYAMQKSLLAFVASVGLIGSAAAVMASPAADREHPGKGIHHRHHAQNWQDKLDLTPEQQAQIQAIYREQRAQHPQDKRQRPTRAEHPSVTDPAYQEKLADYAREQAARTEQRILQQGEIQARVHAVLTPEQREQWQGLRADKGQPWRHGPRKDAVQRGD